MRNRNTRGMIEYLLESVYWNLIVLWCYRYTLFAVVPGLGYDRSVLVLNALVALGVASGFLMTFRHRRNGMSIFVSIACTFGTYFMLSFWRTDWMDFTRILGCALGVGVLYGVLVVINYTRDRAGKRTTASVQKCVYGCFMGARTIVAVGMAVLLVGNWMGLTTVGQRNENLFSGVQEDSDLAFANHMDTVLLLQEEQWETLTLSRRMDVLKLCADIQCHNLGMEPVKVCAKTTEADTLGYYSDSARTVTLNLEHLATGEAREVLDTLFHEIHHAYAHRLAEVYGTLDEEGRKLVLFRDAAGYAHGFANYIDADEDPVGYFYQKVEVDANLFAGHAVAEVYDLIYRYNADHGFPEPEG